jgi:thymidine kinase
VIFFSFISPRTSRRYDPTHIASQRADDDHFPAIEKSAHHIARFAASIGSNSDRRAFEDEAQFFKVDAAFAQDAIALLVIPSLVSG